MTPKKTVGFTLIEMLLVMVIIGMILVASVNFVQQKTTNMRIDKTSLQMQQILNAGLSYYVQNGAWPASLACLQGSSGCTVKYLPSTFVNPWGQPFVVSSNAQLFYVTTSITTSNVLRISATAPANVIAGTLPSAYTQSVAPAAPPAAQGAACDPSTTQCWIVSSVNIPGQNLNNATAINFAGLFHHGACVPVPICPTGMTAQVFVVPVSVSGLNDPNSQNVYPISSFSAYAKNSAANPAKCDGSTSQPACNASPSSASYWRACLQVITVRGNLTDNDDGRWGQYVTLAAFTRCSITNEPSGSPTTVYSD